MYLIDIFEGRLKVDEIVNMDFRLLTQLQSLQEEKLDKQAKEIKARQNNINNGERYVNNSGNRYNKNDNI